MTAISNVTFGMAFKAAVHAMASVGNIDPAAISAKTVEFVDILIALAPEYEIDLTNTSYGSDSSSERQPSGANAEGIPFTVDGIKWLDFRAAKDEGRVKPAFPDFKSADNKESLWLEDREGKANSEAATLAKMADISA